MRAPLFTNAMDTDAVATLPLPSSEPRGALELFVPATLALGRYRVIELLGQGGMSSVYAAYDTLLEREVAIKILRTFGGGVSPDGIALGEATAALQREARMLAAVKHPNVVAVYGLHKDEVPPFLVMERVEGIGLDGAQPATVREALALLRRIADGLDAIHAAGLIHGDIKPSNVLVDARGAVKIVDVGLAPMLERMLPGQILGTPAYIAPEHARGVVLPPALASRSDVYSFAVLAFELLARARPFPDELTGSLLDAHASRPPPRPSEVSSLSSVFDAPFAAALSKDPSERPASAGALMDRLEHAGLSVEPNGAALRVLLVDDDADTSELMRLLITAALEGAIVESACDGSTAMAILGARPPSVAVLDLEMPGLAGVELVAAVRATAPALPLIVCSGTGDERTYRALRALGVRQFLVKPPDAAELVRTIRAVVDATGAAPAPRAPADTRPPGADA
jgi:serine/threonine-protein kinase